MFTAITLSVLRGFCCLNDSLPFNGKWFTKCLSSPPVRGENHVNHGENTTQQWRTHIYTHTLNNLRTQRKKEEKKSFHLQLFSTFQRQPFSQSPTIQQSIPAYTLALFWVSAVVNIDSVRLIRPDSMQPHKTIADRLKANPFLQETNKNVTGVLCFEPMYSYVLTQGEALIYTCSQTKLTVNKCVALNA